MRNGASATRGAILLIGIAKVVGSGGSCFNEYGSLWQTIRIAGIVGNRRRTTRGAILLFGIAMAVLIGGAPLDLCGSYTMSLCSDSAHTAIFRPFLTCYLWSFSWAGS